MKHQFLRHSRAANSVVSDGIQPKFELIQAFMVVIVTCKLLWLSLFGLGCRVVTFLERAAHSVDHMFSLYFDYMLFFYFPFWF